MERQLTLDKWEYAEAIMTENPDLKELVLMKINGHLYKIVRTEKGLVRVHEIQ